MRERDDDDNSFLQARNILSEKVGGSGRRLEFMRLWVQIPALVTELTFFTLFAVNFVGI